MKTQHKPLPKADTRHWLDTQTPAMASLLQEMIALVLAHGGSVHPDAMLVERNGQFTVTCAATEATADIPLFQLPRALLVPVDTLIWSARTDCLALLQPPAQLTAVQRSLLDLHIALYNAADKLNWWTQQHPRSGLPHCSTFTAALAPLHLHPFTPAVSAAEGFLATRTFKLKPAIGNGAAPARVLMPLIDLLNHHHQGAAYKVNESTMTVRVAHSNGAVECHANYGGRKDGLDLALTYGYFDQTTPIAHSGALTLDLPDLGKVCVSGERYRSAHPADPPKLEYQADRFLISHLCCHLDHPQRVRGVLNLALRGLALRRGLDEVAATRAAGQALVAIRDANLTLLTRLMTVCHDLVATTPAAAVVASAAERQAMIIRTVMSEPGKA